jgi:hypothetical protein
MSRFSGQFAAPLSPPIARQPAWTVIFASTKRATNRCGADIFRLPWRACRHGLFRPLQGSEALLYAARCGPCFALFLGSSAVEHSTVNRMVAGSNPARGASQLNYLAANRRSAKIQVRAMCWQIDCRPFGPFRIWPRNITNSIEAGRYRHGRTQKTCARYDSGEAAGDCRPRGQCRSIGASGSSASLLSGLAPGFHPAVRPV